MRAGFSSWSRTFSTKTNSDKQGCSAGMMEKARPMNDGKVHSMKAWRLTGQNIDTLEMRDEPVQRPASGEVQVRIEAAAINSRDIGVACGVYAAASNIIPFSDGAGTIVALGEGVKDFGVGDPIVSCFYENWQAGRGTPANHRRSFGCERDGMLAEIVNLPESAIIRKPRSLSFAEVSTLTCAGLTAWSALFTEAQLQPGQHVVVQGTGGVAIFALQFAKMAGATVTVLSSSDEKLKRAELLGADHLVNYRAVPDWSTEVHDFTDGRGADAVIELGGAATLPQSLACLRMEGMIAVIGLLSGIDAKLSIPLTITRRVRIHGVTVGHREDMQAMAAAIDIHGIKPVIDRLYRFSDAPQAYADLPRGAHFGKLVVTLAD
jgi:NADPH:quinone reductase-like Zn-dependent oxidoreductase